MRYEMAIAERDPALQEELNRLQTEVSTFEEGLLNLKTNPLKSRSALLHLADVYKDKVARLEKISEDYKGCPELRPMLWHIKSVEIISEKIPKIIEKLPKKAKV